MIFCRGYDQGVLAGITFCVRKGEDVREWVGADFLAVV